MLAGSHLVSTWHGVGKAESTIKANTSYRAERERLPADGAIVVEGSRGHLTRDVVFGSPSTAGAVCLGHSCNGRRSGSPATAPRSASGRAGASSSPSFVPAFRHRVVGAQALTISEIQSFNSMTASSRLSATLPDVAARA